MAFKAYELSFDGDPAEPEFYDDVQLLLVHESLSSPSTFSLRIGLTRDASGEWIGVDDARFGLMQRIAVSIGFVPESSGSGGGGGPQFSPVIDGYVTDVDIHVGADPADAYLEIHGTDASVLLTFEEKVVAWPNMADSDIASQIVSSYGITIDATSTTPVRQDNDVVLVQRGSDAEFIRRIARRHGYEFAFSREDSAAPVTCYFGPPRLDRAPQRDLAVQFGARSNLISFTASVSGLRPLAVHASQVDARTKSVVAVDANEPAVESLGASSLKDLVGGALDSLITPNRSQGQMLLVAGSSADEAELKAYAQAARDGSEWLITARGEINSDAYGAVLRPGVAQLKGAGKLYSGKYYVTDVWHRIAPDGTHAQTFEARRNARDLQGTERFGEDEAAGVAT